MDTLDTYYRALLEFKKIINDNNSCKNNRNIIRKSNIENDLLNSINYIIDVDNDWIVEIENSLDAIGKCIAEGRQFIRRNGNLTKIEKVKSVSKESVSHLARHSNLITKQTESDIVPDELYTVEKLSDYAVYENRFLYMLLCYTRDFILLRYDKIIEYSQKYNSILRMNKHINIGNRVIDYTIDFNETINDDELKKKNCLNKDIIDRIDTILQAVISYLNTQLMREVSKSPMIKPPITKTNVLKMNQNFIKAVNLYNFITSYDKLGYSIKEEINKITPFKDEESDTFANLIELNSYLSYIYSNNLSIDLKQKYELLEAKRIHDEEEKHKKQLRLLKKKVEESSLSIEEYTLELEKRITELEKSNEKYAKLNDENYHLKQIIHDLEVKLENNQLIINNQEETIFNQNMEIKTLTKDYEYKIETLIKEHKEEIETYEYKIEELIRNHEILINELKDSYEKQINELIDKYTNTINELKENHEQEINELKNNQLLEIETINSNYEEKINNLNKEFESKIIDLNNELNFVNEKLIDIENYNKLILDEKMILLAELNSIRFKYGLQELNEIDFTDETRFKELEEELVIFKKLFTNKWQITKKRIYRELKEKYLGKK